MAAPIGNQFWKLRTKHGRDRIIQSPEVLWEACCEYFEAMDKREDWKRTEFVGRDGSREEVTLKPPYTYSSMCVFLDIPFKTLLEYEKRDGFSEVLTRVREIIVAQKFEGATVGAYNATIIARDLGLVEKSNTTIAIEQPMFPDETSKPKE